MYSAIKVNGRRLYELAREGKNVERKTRMVDIGSIEILEIAVPRIRMRVECSKGTYIRTLCHDIGEKLGVHGCMEELTRISSGSFRLENAYKLEEIEKLEMQGTLSSILLPVEEMFSAYPVFSLKKEFDKVLQNGNPFPLSMTDSSKLPELADGTKVRVHDSRGDFQAIYEYRMEKGMFFPLKMFLA
jgi:tRNA pseudouridine55 synthase